MFTSLSPTITLLLQLGLPFKPLYGFNELQVLHVFSRLKVLSGLSFFFLVNYTVTFISWRLSKAVTITTCLNLPLVLATPRHLLFSNQGHTYFLHTHSHYGNMHGKKLCYMNHKEKTNKDDKNHECTGEFSFTASLSDLNLVFFLLFSPLSLRYSVSQLCGCCSHMAAGSSMRTGSYVLQCGTWEAA